VAQTVADIQIEHEIATEIASRVRGKVIRPDDVEFDEARKVYNGMIDRRPGAIVRCTGAADVIAAVNLAREHQIPFSVRGGGHNVAGLAVCDGGMMIDLSPMKSVRVEPATRSVRAEPGVTWREFDHETQAFGLATTGGAISTTGIAGLTLGGGLGFLMRKHGLACDNLISADVVTADGELVRASLDENADLFWALRGGGGNFGIVTSLEYQLHPLGPVLGGLVIHPLSAGKDLLRFYREFIAVTPDELTVYVGFITLPDGKPAVAFAICYAGPVAAGEATLKPLRQFGTPLADLVAPTPYVDVQRIFDPSYPSGLLNYWQGSFMRELTDDAIDALVESYAAVPSTLSAVAIEHMGGAVRARGDTDSAFSHRSASLSVIITSLWSDAADSAINTEWARQLWRQMERSSTGASYVNYLGEGEPEDRVRAAYGQSYSRLVDIKRKYDPANLFRMNQNIRPA
jgi:FAD/FMN-containing dehydrogenase